MDKELKKCKTRTFYGLLNLLQRYHWQWHVTLTFSGEFSNVSIDSYNTINRLILRWARELQTSENIQIAFFMVLCIRQGHPHVHLLMFGSNNDGAKNLSDISKSKWANRWPYFAKIEIIEEQQKVIRYVAKHLLIYEIDNSQSYDDADYVISESYYDFYNRNLLKRFENQSIHQG